VCRGCRVYCPVLGSFLFGDYCSADVILFGEFSWDRFRVNYPQLECLLEGKGFSVDVKCRSSLTLRSSVLMLNVGVA
jgi:hypothetical protein